MFVRSSFTEGVGRYQQLFSKTPPFLILQFSERVPLFKGRVDPRGGTATSYCWVVWHKYLGGELTYYDWIPPCRKRLERKEDYAPLLISANERGSL